MKIVIVDYGMGNVQSISNALTQFENVNVILSDSSNEILEGDGVILPGVGAFNRAMSELNARDLPDVLNKCVVQKKPILGICLGMQLLFDSSEEFGHTKGLGFVKGVVERFPAGLSEKLPHISWNSVEKQKIDWDNTILKGIKDKDRDNFYFVHSYICKPKDQNIIVSKTEYGEVNFCSVIQKDNLYGCQFHPEKSAASGLNVLKNFISIIKGGL